MRALFFLFMLMAPVAALAQQVTVRSGEHADFSRLVLGFDASAGWRLGRIDGGWEFRATDSTVSFDAGRVFDLIPKTRIAAVETPAPGILRLLVVCDCHVDGFELRRSRVVIDVKDGPAPPGNAFEVRLDTVSERPRESEVPPAAGTEAGALSAGPEVAAGLANAIADAARSPSERVLPSVVLAPADLPRDAEMAARSREFESRILGELARAGSQGLIVPAEVKPTLSPVDEGDGPAAVPPVPAPGPADAEPAPPFVNPADLPADNVRVETSVDRDAKGAASEGGDLTDLGDSCPSPRSVDLPSWGVLTQGGPEIGQYRADLTGEFDEVVPEKAMRLARYYVFLTFGAEARQILDLIPETEPDQRIVAAMAEILDHEGAGPAGLALDRYETCDSPAALWSVLAGPALRPDIEVNENAVVRAFGTLPDHARLLLGPRLVEAFTAAERLEAAQMLRNAIQLSTGEGTVDAALASAQLDEAMGRPDKAESTLDHALAETDADAPEALVALAETRLRRGEALDQATFEVLESLAFELRGTPVADRIERSLAEALIVTGQFRDARRRIADRLVPKAEPAAPALLRRLYLMSSETAAAADFLRLVLPAPEGLGREPEDAPARLAIARRLVTLGFDGDALAVLGAEANGADRAARLIAGQAHLSLGHPDATLAALAALDGPEASGMMAEAQESLGNIAEARRLFGLAGRDADAERMAVREGDWQALSASGDPVLRALAERLAEPAPPLDRAGEPYETARRLIESASGDRVAVGGYLSPRPLN
jgi:tetratricopeptide (TPR) repeat protein